MRRYAITAAVMAGSLVLFVPLTVATLLGALETIGEALGLDSVTSGAFAVLAVCCGYVTAMEIARVRLHGFDELHRGSRPRQIARHTVLAIVSLAAGVVLTDLLVEGVSVGIGNGQPVVAAAAAASLVALAWVAVRSLRAFCGGIRRPARPR